ncbi:hypothetical protein AMTR_s00103p00135740 [Amborella trichopoda]|uniref:Uncharacterized protein n=1 Tax=Amborella trichopoda TaxID=13333 RepID=W1P1Q7_AMBTC|nr:hypothetical protein AMTR_s00103p00135740 [Amborella trichopoda]
MRQFEDEQNAYEAMFEDMFEDTSFYVPLAKVIQAIKERIHKANEGDAGKAGVVDAIGKGKAGASKNKGKAKACLQPTQSSYRVVGCRACKGVVVIISDDSDNNLDEDSSSMSTSEEG